MGKLFGTDGIRGLANRAPITADLLLQIGRALGEILARRNPGARVVIGRDTRRSGPMLEGAVLAGLCSAGCNVLRAGVIPTPAIAFLTRALEADAGAVISASHNPFADNGIKLFSGEGFKIADEDEAAIETALSAGSGERVAPTAEGVGAGERLSEATGRYVDSLLASVPTHGKLSGMKVALDCANGAAFQAGPLLFERCGAQLEVLAAEPDGVNINVDCGALHPRRLQDAVIARGAALGIAVDGDADRLMLVDERGEMADGDDVVGILAADLQSRGRLRVPTAVATVMSNMGLELYLRGLGIALARTAVGDRHVVEEMRRSGAQVGGEPSGHLILLDHSTTGDGLLAALQVADVMVRTGKPLSELKRRIAKLPQLTVNVRVARRVDLNSLGAVQDAIRQVERQLHDRGRVLVRYSGTEPLVRVMVEGEAEAEVKAHAEKLAEAVRLGVAQA